MNSAREPARFAGLEQLFVGTAPGSVPRPIQEWVRIAMQVIGTDVASPEAREIVRGAYAAAFELARDLGHMRRQRPPRVGAAATVADRGHR
ncbi:MAG: hypothetical protein IPK26_02030 [Planctomycetes bacterium]|nr:hypothetical protein [Planctomycetota bacterium]